VNKFYKEMLVLQKENIIYGILGLQGFLMLIFGYSIYFSTPKQTTPENQTITLIVKELPSCLSTLKEKSGPEPPMRTPTPGDPASPLRPHTAPAKTAPAVKNTDTPPIAEPKPPINALFAEMKIKRENLKKVKDDDKPAHFLDDQRLSENKS
jgi:hypothetical protein